MCRVHWIQHAVGHGGFHTGQIYSGAGSRMMEEQPDFTWIFDCGSRAYSKLDAFLRLWTRRQGRPVDWLFISHFDFDHVSGLDELMSRSVVNDVMVPYVNEDELAYTLLEEIGRGNVAPAFVSLVADPASFFLTRGAARVTFLRGREGERPPEVDLRPGDPGDRFETDDGWGVEMSQAEKLDMSDCTGGRSETGPVIRVVDEGLCEIKATRGRCSLLLKAYRAPVSRTANEDLMTALHARFGTMPWAKSRPGLGDLAYAIAHHARTTAGRNELRTLFTEHIGSSNRSSLSLLSLPDGGHLESWVWGVDHGSRWHENGPAAWMSTGDAELLDPVDLDDWVSHFRNELQHVRMLALPHHGSDRNSDASLQRECPNARLLAAVKAGAKKHPGMGVSSAAGLRLSLVTGDTGTDVQMWTNP